MASSNGRCGGRITPDRRTGGAVRAHAHTHVSTTQAAAFESFMRTHSMSETARELGVCQIRVRELLVQYQRNLMRDSGQKPPPLRQMLRGDVVTRFGISRDVLNGRPARHHPPADHGVPAAPSTPWRSEPESPRVVASPRTGTRRLIVTGVEGGQPAHAPFVANLQAYAQHLGAEILALRSDHDALGPTASPLAGHVTTRAVEIADAVHLRPDVALPKVALKPLDRMEGASPGRWGVFAHRAFELRSLPRLASRPPRVQLTTGMATRARGRDGDCHPGAVVIEVHRDGGVHLRHVRGAMQDGSFHDLDAVVRDGRVLVGAGVEAIVFGDIHHARIDPAAVRATWGGASDGTEALVDRLRPRLQVMHDVCDFLARSHHHRGDPHASFVKHVTGTGNVRREMEGVAAFLSDTRRSWSRTVVVASNHDAHLLRWLREADHRTDPENAEYYLERQRALLARLRAGGRAEGFFAQTLRELRADCLEGVRFLADGESLTVAGVECGVHGHAGVDGQRGSTWSFERFGTDMVIGHGHRPMALGRLYMTGVCQLDLGYNRGPTTWAVAHVLVHADGARQHVFLERDRFHA